MTEIVMTVPAPQWDAFISYASEDRLAAARPLAELLRACGLRIWYDEFNLEIGDSLSRKIDEGLANSRYGVVLLSHAFFSKHFPQKELSGLTQREVGGTKVILPVWIDVDESDIRKYSPTLADRKGLLFTNPFDCAWQLARTISPKFAQSLSEAGKGIVQLIKVEAGSDLVALFSAADMGLFFNEDPVGRPEAELVSRALTTIRDQQEILEMDEDPGIRVQVAFELTQVIDELQSNMWQLYGSNRTRIVSIKEKSHPFREALIALVRSGHASVFVVGNRLSFIKHEVTDTAE